MSEYLSPSETFGRHCEKPADVSADAYIHEISNQVTIILGISELAQEAGRENLAISKHIEQIAQAARRAARATHRLLELKAKDLGPANCRVVQTDEETTVLP